MGTPRLPKGHFRREGRGSAQSALLQPRALRGHRPLTATAAKAPRRARVGCRLPLHPHNFPTSCSCKAPAEPPRCVRGNQKAPCAAAPPNPDPWPRGSGRATPRADNTEQLAQSSRHTARWVLKAEGPTHWRQRPRSTLGVRTRAPSPGSEKPAVLGQVRPPGRFKPAGFRPARGRTGRRRLASGSGGAGLAARTDHPPTSARAAARFPLASEVEAAPTPTGPRTRSRFSQPAGLAGLGP